MTVHLTHWGAFEAVSDGERLTEVRPWRGDPEPMPQIGNVASAQHHPARITRPQMLSLSGAGGNSGDVWPQQGQVYPAMFSIPPTALAGWRSRSAMSLRTSWWATT